MGEIKDNHKENLTVEHEGPLKGTWFSLGVLGFVIFVTYILLFWFFMDRV